MQDAIQGSQSGDSVIRHPAENYFISSANCRFLQRLPSSKSPKPCHTLWARQDTPAEPQVILRGCISPISPLQSFQSGLFIFLDSPSHLTAAGLQSCSWHFHLYYCWLGTQLPVWPLPLPVTPERRGSCWDCSSCGRENALQGLFSQTLPLPAILIPQVIPVMGRRDLPFPPKDIHALSGGCWVAEQSSWKGSQGLPL